jgi:hypothetical protein
MTDFDPKNDARLNALLSAKGTFDRLDASRQRCLTELHSERWVLVNIEARQFALKTKFRDNEYDMLLSDFRDMWFRHGTLEEITDELAVCRLLTRAAISCTTATQLFNAILEVTIPELLKNFSQYLDAVEVAVPLTHLGTSTATTALTASHKPVEPQSLTITDSARYRILSLVNRLCWHARFADCSLGARSGDDGEWCVRLQVALRTVPLLA